MTGNSSFNQVVSNFSSTAIEGTQKPLPPAKLPPPATFIAPTPNNHELNPAFFLPRSALLEPNARALVHRSRTNRYYSRNYAELANRVKGLAYYFKHHGYKRIAILAPNTPAHLETMFAANAAGGIIMGVNYRLTKKEIDYILNLGEADLVIVDREYVGLADELPGRKVIIDDDVADDEVDKLSCAYGSAVLEGMTLAEQTYGSRPDWEDLNTEHIDENGTMGLFFTSGTTGNPKAVEYTHRGVYLATLAQIVECGLNCQTSFGKNRCSYLWTLPMFHAAGWTFPYAVTAARGTHICLRKINPDQIWDILLNERVTHFSAAPTVNTMILNSKKAVQLPQEVSVVVAAAPPSAKLFGEMISHNLVPVHTYGLTETYGPFARRYFLEEWNKLPSDEVFRLMARQGFSFLTSANMKVVREGKLDEPVLQNGTDIGEIVIRGNIVAKGYYRDPEATAKAFEGGWFRTGDLAVVHPDGAAEVLDRKKDIIISGGENISSVAVESHIVKYHNILEVAVIGIPDEHYGELPYAFVTWVLLTLFSDSKSALTNILVCKTQARKSTETISDNGCANFWVATRFPSE